MRRLSCTVVSGRISSQSGPITQADVPPFASIVFKEEVGVSLARGQSTEFWVLQNDKDPLPMV